jgi:hypothetical protein
MTTTDPVTFLFEATRPGVLIVARQQRHRVQNLLFEGGLSYSEKSGILNRSKTSLFSVLELVRDSEVSLASPTGFEPVFTP